MELQKNMIQLKVASDGAATWLDTANVFQFSNETAGVNIYTPFDSTISTYINIRLPDKTVIQEKPMAYLGQTDLEGVQYHVWQYLFNGLETGVSGSNFAAGIIISFRFQDQEGGSKTSNQINIPVQPSLKGAAMYVDPSTAETLNAKIDRNSQEIAEHENKITGIFDASETTRENAEEAQRIAEGIRTDNTQFKADMTAQQGNFVREVNTRQETYEQSVMERQSGYEAELTTRQGNYERTVNIRMTAAEGTANRAAQLAGGLDSQIKQAVTGAEQANVTADAAKRIATDAKEGSGTAVKRQNGEALDFIPEVVLEGAGDSVMTSDEVKKQLIGTVQERSYSGEVMSLPGTTVGELNGYEVYGKSVQHISPNLLTTQPSINNQITTLVDFGKDVTFSGVISLAVIGFVLTETSGAIFDFLKADGTHQYKRITECGWEKNHTYNGVISYKFTNITFQRLVFYGFQNNYSHMSGTILSGMLNEGTEALPYEPYTGQPKPDNPIAIQSAEWPLTVQTENKNIFSTDKMQEIMLEGRQDVYTVINHNSFDFTGNLRRRVPYHGFLLRLSKNTDYTISFSVNVDNPTEKTRVWVSCFDMSNGPYQRYDVATSGVYRIYNYVYMWADSTRKSITFNTKNVSQLGIMIMTDDENNAGDIIMHVTDVQLEMGTTATAFEPYRGVTTDIHPTLLDGTPYTEPLRSIGDVHDTLNRANNTITQRIGNKTFDGNSDNKMTQSSPTLADKTIYQIEIPGAKIGQGRPAICDKFNFVSGQYINNDFTGATSWSEPDGIFMVQIPKTWVPPNDVAAFRAWLSENPLTVQYELATPITHQLQPLPAIPTLDGHTTIYATNDFAPEIWCEEWDKRCIGNPVLLTNSAGETLNPVTVKNMVLDRDTGIDLETELDGVQRNMEAVQAAAYEAHEAMLNSVLEKDYNGTVLTLPDTEAGFLNDYAVHGETAVNGGQPAPNNPALLQSTEWPLEVVSCKKNLLNPDMWIKRYDNTVIEGNRVTVSSDTGGLFWELPIGLIAKLKTFVFSADVTIQEVASTEFHPSCTLRIGYVPVHGQPSTEWILSGANNVETECSTIQVGVKKRLYLKPNLTNPRAGYDEVLFAITLGDPNATCMTFTYENPKIEIGTELTAYEPYQGATTSIQPVLADGTPYAEPLRSVGDAHDTLNRSNNTITQRVSEINLRGRTWQLGGSADSANRFYYAGSLPDVSNVNAVGRQMCNVASSQDIGLTNTYTGFIATTGAIRFRPDLTKYPTLASWQEYSDSHDIIITYALATPITHQLQPLPDIPTLDGYTTIYTANTPQPGLWCQEWDRASLGDPVTLVGQDGRTKNPVTRWDLVLEEGSGKKLSAELENLNHSVKENQSVVTEVKSDLDAIIAGSSSVPLAAKANADSIGNVITDTYAKQSGTYANLTAGNAQKINGVQITRTAGTDGYLSEGGFVIPKKKLLSDVGGSITSTGEYVLDCSNKHNFRGSEILEFDIGRKNTYPDDTILFMQHIQLRMIAGGSRTGYSNTVQYDGQVITIDMYRDSVLRFSKTSSGTLDIANIYVVIDC